MTMVGIREIKNELRQRARGKRTALDPAHRARAEERIRQAFLSLLCLREARTLLVYYPRQGELDILPLVRACRERGIAIAYPRCGDGAGEMEFYYVRDEAALLPGKYGIPEPQGDAERYRPEDGTRDICLVPGLLFDRSGGRLGYGGGYYDRYLARFSGLRIGLCMQTFVHPTPLPKGRYDLPIHILVTEKGVTTVHAL